MPQVNSKESLQQVNDNEPNTNVTQQNNDYQLVYSSHYENTNQFNISSANNGDSADPGYDKPVHLVNTQDEINKEEPYFTLESPYYSSLKH